MNELDTENICEDLIVKLKENKLPLILWGCGDVADAVYNYLTINNISISQVWVEKCSEPSNFHGLIPKSMQEILADYQKFNVILGHSHYEKGEEIIELYPQIQNVYYVFSVHYEQYNKVAYSEIEKEADRFVQLCNNLADNISKENLFAYLNTKLTGDAAHIINVYSQELTFFNNDVYRVSEQETFLDIGAYNGDTIRDFISETNNSYKKIIAIEPDVKNFIDLNRYLAERRLRRVVPSMIGAWNCNEKLTFNTGNEQISSVAQGSDILKDSNKLTISAAPIDDVFGEENITLIKINYFEGVLEALEGCEKIIRKNHPKLAVTVGFDIYNILKISEYISNLNVNYKLYLRFNRAMSSTFTLYAV